MRKHVVILLCAAAFVMAGAGAVMAGDEGDASLEERVGFLEEQVPEFLTFGGVVETEIGFESTDEGDTSDIVLATVELGVDVALSEYVNGYVLFLYEEDDTEEVVVDEGVLILNGGEKLPLFLGAGKMYLPFGNFESHFVSDPLTVEIGEICQSGLLVGFANEMMEFSATMFNGDVDETGEEDGIGSFVLSGMFALPEAMSERVGLAAGLSFISNIGDTDGLEGETPGELSSAVAGFSAFVSVCVMEKFFLEAEYLAAAEEFEAGELSFDGGEEAVPAVWNLELGLAATDRLELAVKYEGGKDLGDFLPDQRYGVVAGFGLFDGVCLAAEFLHGEYDAGGEVDTLTAQLAIEF
jgi:hypothetical protein